MSITFRQLEIFEVIHRTGSFAAAANALDISQASVSKQIAALENHLGIALFTRERGRKAELTADARYLPSKVEQLLALSKELLPPVAEAPVVRVVCGDVIGAMIYRSLSSLLQRHPQLELEIILKEPVIESVAAAWAEDIDVACFTLRQPPPLAEAEFITRVRVGIFVKKGSELECDWMGSEQSLPVVFPLKGTPLERNFSESLGQIGIKKHHVAMRVQSEQSRVDVAIKGAGAILAPYSKVKKEVAQGLLVPIDVPEHFVYRYIFVNPALSERKEVNWVVEYLRQIISSKE